MSNLSFFPGNDHLFTLAPPLLKLLLGVLSFVLLPSFDRFELLGLNVAGLLHNLGYVSVALYSADFRPAES